jgi:hypothetical protein
MQQPKLAGGMRRSTAALAAIGVTLVTYLGLVFIHELIHLVINVALTGGDIGTCYTGIPFKIESGRPYTCLAAGGNPSLNALITPYATSLLGLALMVLSPRLDKRYLRWGVFGGGVLSWSLQALYGMGFYTPPMLTHEGVKYIGDGVTALEAYGKVSQIPGFVLIIIGVLYVLRKTEFDRDGRGL